MKVGRKIKPTILVALLIIASTALLAEVPDMLRLPEIDRRPLLNGMQTLFFDSEGDRCHFVMMIENGAAFDPVDKWGATYVMMDLVVEGLAERNLAPEFTARNIELTYEVDWDALYLIGSAPSKDMEFALMTLAELVVEPNFTEEGFQRSRDKLLAKLKEKDSDIGSITQALFISRIFGANPYSHSVKGTVETIENLDLRDIKIQARRLLLPNQARLALAFSGDRDNLFRRLSRRWGAWVRQEAAPFTFRQSNMPSEDQIVLVPHAEEGRSLIRWGYLGVERSSRQYLTYKVLEQYLTLSLPDWAQEVAAQTQIRGYARVEARKMPGFLQISLDSAPERVPTYLRKFRSVLAALKEGQINEKRFAEAKLLLLQELQSNMDNPLARIREVLATELYDLGINFIPTFPLRLERVTPEVFRNTVKEGFPEGGSVAVIATPNDSMKAELEELGKVEVLN